MLIIIFSLLFYSFMLRNIAYYSTRAACYSNIISQNFARNKEMSIPPVVKDSLSNFLKPDARTNIPVCKPRLCCFCHYIKNLYL